MKIRFDFSLLLLLMLVLSSCEDIFEPSGIETRVYGRMYDSQNELPLTNHKLRIGEYNLTPGFGSAPNIDFIQYVDSSTTDSAGFFDFAFTTSGQGDRYQLEVDFDYDNYFGLTDDNVFGLLNQELSTELDTLGVDNEINYEVLFFFPVNLKFTLDSDVQFLPIRIREPFSRVVDNLTETGVGISRIYHIDKNLSWQIELTRTTSDGQAQHVIFDMPATNSTDLAEFEFYINDSDFIDY
ncbi:hypothetical protein [Winogradskyella ursingii]|uniref:hypothetical protein n=1 Tax=Winogradskyella ursingii TaxID=2686079 RepID=UPI0015CB048C|nr:hypothetical protein [Winogradskyella ursingii]